MRVSALSEGCAGPRIKIVVSVLCLAAVLCAVLPDVRLLAQSEPIARQSLGAPVTGDDPGRAQKLFEAVSGYLQGFHLKGKQTDKKGEVGPRRWSGPTRVVSDEQSSLRLTVEIDETLARSRLERHEWDLAIPPLERALKTSSRLVSADDTARLKDTLQTARAKSQNTALEKSPTRARLPIPSECVS